MAHELGHAVLHSNKVGMGVPPNELLMYNEKNRLEYEANVFAAELLTSDEEVIDALSEARLNDSAPYINMPDELLDFRLRSMQWRGLDVPEWGAYTQNDFLRKWDGSAKGHGRK